MLRDKTLEKLVYELTDKIYTIFKEYDFYTSEDEVLQKIEKSDPHCFMINIYSLFHLKIMKLVQHESKNMEFFDQKHKFVPHKSIHNDGNFFCSMSEIQNIANDIPKKPSLENLSLQIFMRTRALSIIGEWDMNVDCDSLFYNQKCSKSFLEKCKSYFLNNSKYLKYTRLLLSALENGEYFEHLIPVSTTLEQYTQFLYNPFIFVMLKPYNFILYKKKEEEYNKRNDTFDFLDELMNEHIITD